VTRDYVLDLDTAEDRAAMLSIFGGKITTYRKLAEHAMTQLAPFFPDRNTDLTKSWTATVALPGGDLPESDFDRYLEALIRAYPDLPAALLRRLGRAYGTRVDRILGAARTTAELGEDFGAGLHAAEIDYLVDQEWARSADDILYRRSKLGLHVPADAAARIDAYLADRIDAAAGGAPPPAAAPDQIRVSPA
jgi:glycerol-3-phosphate dehydrogenase